MFFIYSIIMFLFFSATSFITMNVTGNNEVFLPFTIIFLCLGLIFGIIAFFVNLSQWTEQIKRFESIRKFKSLLKLKQEQFDSQKEEWIKYLSIEYPNFEKGVFEKMLPQEKSQLQMFFAKYPELNSSSMFTLLINKIDNMTSEIYHITEKMEFDTLIIRSQNQNRWLLITPNIPEDIKDMIYKK